MCAHACAFDGKGCGAHVRARVSLCECAHRGCACMYMCVRELLCALADAGARAGAYCNVTGFYE